MSIGTPDLEASLNGLHAKRRWCRVAAQRPEGYQPALNVAEAPIYSEFCGMSLRFSRIGNPLRPSVRTKAKAELDVCVMSIEYVQSFSFKNKDGYHALCGTICRL